MCKRIKNLSRIFVDKHAKKNLKRLEEIELQNSI